MNNLSPTRYIFRETPFEKLMQNRISDILLICSQYDKFMLDEDGKIDEQLFVEYASLNLRYPPRFTHVSTEEEAFSHLETEKYDLVITMLSVKGSLVFGTADRIKETYPNISVVALSPFSSATSRSKEITTTKADYVFSWLGNARLLLSIVKLMEDSGNVEQDVATGSVQVIILVEDSVRYYSSYLPMIYRLLFKQAGRIMEEGRNRHEQNTRMRGRPKILLATTFNEAITLYEKYKNNVLGIISDIGYKIDHTSAEEDPKAGLKLCKIIRENDKETPILLQSAQIDLKPEAEKHDASFICKHSESLLNDLRSYIKEKYGFGDLIFLGTKNEPFEKASNLKELQEKLTEMPSEIFARNVGKNLFSKWLRARALFGLADVLKPVQLADVDNSPYALKTRLLEIIKQYREEIAKGSIATFDDDKFDNLTHFSRIGDGSLGGKGRGLAFIDSIIKKKGLSFKFESVNISIPRTIVISTSVFEDYMELNNLYSIAFSTKKDEVILQKFLKAKLPPYAKKNIKTFLSSINTPLAVRSSSLLEDSLYQPFAGVYSTYMLSNNSPEIAKRMQQLEQAVKCVYASTYYKQSKAYISATKNVIDEEKMAVVIQEVAGKTNGNYFYPDFAGVARSYNYYPLSGEKTEQGIAEVALGLGKTIVDSGTGVRFNPAHPKKVVQFSTVESTIASSQKVFYALDLVSENFRPSVIEEANIPLLDVKEAEEIPAFRYMVSTHDMQNNIMRDAVIENGSKFITFAGILKYNMFPLAKILSKILELGQEAMKCPIEIEFAVNIDPEGNEHIFSFLQIRPVVEGQELQDFQADTYNEDDAIISSVKALGHGKYDDITDFVYIKPESFNPAHTKKIAECIGKINSSLAEYNRNYILLVPGRLGSRDPWLGVPVTWEQISNARVIIETGLKDFQVDPSQGTHFFHNITSLGIAYFTVNPIYKDGSVDYEFLESQTPVYEDDFIRHLKFDDPVIAVVDGKNRRGLVLKPKPE